MWGSLGSLVSRSIPYIISLGKTLLPQLASTVGNALSNYGSNPS